MSIQGSDESVISYPSSFSDQDFKAFGGPSFVSTGASKDSDNNVKECRSTSFDRVKTTHEHQAITDTETPTELHLSTTFTSSLFLKDIYDAGEVVIYPKCMHRKLSSEYPKILSVLEDTYRQGAFIYVGASFQCLFHGNPQNFHKIKTNLMCDMCIFPKNMSVILVTVADGTTGKYDLHNYNVQMKRNLEACIGETIPEFKALCCVIGLQLKEFEIRGKFGRLNAERRSLTKGLPPPQMTLPVEAFLQKLANCKFVQRFHVDPVGSVYLVQDLFEDFIELMEDTEKTIVYPKSTIVRPKSSAYTTLLVCELAYRLALIGHTTLHSNTEVKKEFEELRKAKNISIFIVYDAIVDEENLQEGDILLSSWKGSTILFRTGMRHTDTARRTLASAVVERSGKMADVKRRNRLLDLVCLKLKMMEQHLEDTLRRVDSKSQIAELETLTTSLHDPMTETISVNNQDTNPMRTLHEAHTEYLLPTLEEKSVFDDRTEQQAHDVWSTDFDTPQRSYRRRNDANYSDSGYKDATRAIRGQLSTHSGMPGPDSHITYKDEQRQSRGPGPSPHRRSNPANTSPRPPIRQGVPKHRKNPDKVSNMKPKPDRDQPYDQHSLHLVGESRLTNQVTTRASGDRSVQSSSFQMFRSDNVDTGLQKAQRQHNLNLFTGHRHKSEYGNTPNPRQKHYEKKKYSF